MRAERPCSLCDTPTRNAKFCSRRCAGILNTTKQHTPAKLPPERPCAGCDTPTRKKFCSSKCSGKAGAAARVYVSLPKATHPCDYCDAETTNRVYCSHVCASSARRRPPQEKRQSEKWTTKYRALYMRAYRYGMTVDELMQFLATRSDMCEICERRPATCIDHCHQTGRVRGHLCSQCNTALGFLGDSAAAAQAAADYLNQWA